MTKDLETNQKAEIQYQRESQLVASLRQEYNVLNQQFFTYKTNYPIESVNLAKVSQEDKATQTEDLVTIQQDNSTQTGDLPILFDQSVKSKYALLNRKFHGAMILNNMSQNAVERLQQELDSVSPAEFAENLFLNHHRVTAAVAEMFKKLDTSWKPKGKPKYPMTRRQRAIQSHKIMFIMNLNKLYFYSHFSHFFIANEPKGCGRLYQNAKGLNLNAYKLILAFVGFYRIKDITSNYQHQELL
jgi:hypothetical protein